MKRKHTTQETPAPATSPKATFTIDRDAEGVGDVFTLAEVRELAEPGDVFGLVRPEGSKRKGLAMKRVLLDDGTFGAVFGGELSGEWPTDDSRKAVFVGKRVPKAAAAKQQPKAKAKARARKAQAKAAPATSERTPAQHAATVRMLEGKRDKLSGDKAARKAAQASLDAYKSKHGLA